jgi:multidrug efflux pump subunit AcrA (membrane-fusion protein)
MLRTTLFIRITLSLVLIAALGLAGCSSSSSTSANTVGTVSTVSITDVVETSGSLTADKLATLKWRDCG